MRPFKLGELNALVDELRRRSARFVALRPAGSPTVHAALSG